MATLELPPDALHVLQRQRNIITVGQLTSAGTSRAQRERLVNRGVLEHAGHSVLRVVGLTETLETRLITLCLQHPKGMITGPTLGKLEGLRRMPPTSPVHFSLPHGSRADVPRSVRLRRSRYLPEAHRRQLENGMVVATWPRLAFDLAADLGPRALASVVEQLLHEQKCTEVELGAIAGELCARGRPGSARFATTLLRRHGRAPSESHPELLVLEKLHERGVPVVPQVELLRLPDGRSVRIDLAVAELRWAVEIDAHPAHLDLLGTTSDKQRDRQLHLIGWQVERVTPLDLLDIDGCCDELAALYAARVAALTR